MRARHNHQLPNLSPGKRVLATLALLLGFGLFVSVWFASAVMGGWGLGGGEPGVEITEAVSVPVVPEPEAPAAAPTAEVASSASAPDTSPASAPAERPTAASGAAPPPAATSAPVPSQSAPVADASPVEATPAAPEPSPAAAPVRYALDPAHSLLYVQVFRNPDTVASGISHDHVILATDWTGTVLWTVGEPKACAVEIHVPTRGLRVDLPELRTKVGYDVMLTDNQRSQVAEHMLARGQLDASAFPEVSFRSTACAADGERVQVTGDLSLHGVTRSVSLPMTIRADGSAFSALGTLKFSGSTFGITPYQALLGALKNQDLMSLTVNVRGGPG